MVDHAVACCGFKNKKKKKDPPKINPNQLTHVTLKKKNFFKGNIMHTRRNNN